jgi:hypothetical protein
MMTALVIFAVAQLGVGLAFQRFALGEQLFFIGAVTLRLRLEIGAPPAAIRGGDFIHILLDAFGLIKIPIISCLVLHQHRGVLIADGRCRFDRLQTADGRRYDGENSDRDRYLRQERVVQMRDMLSVGGVILDVLVTMTPDNLFWRGGEPRGWRKSHSFENSALLGHSCADRMDIRCRASYKLLLNCCVAE